MVTIHTQSTGLGSARRGCSLLRPPPTCSGEAIVDTLHDGVDFHGSRYPFLVIQLLRHLSLPTSAGPSGDTNPITHLGQHAGDSPESL